MIGIGGPRGRIRFIRLIAPSGPSPTLPAGEKLDEWAGAAGFDDVVLLVRLTRMFALHTGEVVNLSSSRRERPGVLPADSEQDQLSDVAEIKADSSAIRAPVLTDLVPYKIALIPEAPSLHNRKTIRKEGIGAPKVQMCGRRSDPRDRKTDDVLQF